MIYCCSIVEAELRGTQCFRFISTGSRGRRKREEEEKGWMEDEGPNLL